MLTFRTYLENKDIFNQTTLGLNTLRGKEIYSVPKLAAYAKKTLPLQNVSIDWLRNNVIDTNFKNLWKKPDRNGAYYEQSLKARTYYPILLLKDQSGIRVGDGNHRIFNAIHISHLENLPAYIIEPHQLPPSEEL